MKKGVIILDFDDVLVNFSMLFYKFIRMNWRFFFEFFKDIHTNDIKELMNRDVFNLEEFLLKDEVKNNLEIREKVHDYCVKNFFSKDIYINAEILKFGKGFSNTGISMNVFEKVYIISRNLTPEQDKSKKDFIKRFFNNNKIEYISVGKNESKGEVISSKYLNFNVFVDDEIYNIDSVVESLINKDPNLIRGKEFLIPKYGYNRIDPEMKRLIESLGGSINLYDPF